MTFLNLKSSILLVCNYLLLFIQKEVLVTGLRAEASKGAVTLLLKGQFNSNGDLGMLKVREYQCIGMVSFLSCEYFVSDTGYIEDREMKRENTIYFALLLDLVSRISERKGNSEPWISSSLRCK